jgi:arabinan endo-1,5-alpha-L-arabinosidase
MKSRFTLVLVMVAMLAALTLTVAEAQRRGGGPLPTYPPGERERVINQLGSRGVRVHDPSTIIKDKDEYWVFYTGGGVPSYHSKDLVTWEPGPRIFNSNPPWLAQVVPPGQGRRGGRGAATAPSATGPSTGPASAAARGRGRGFGGGIASFWAPDVVKVGDQYMVFFSYSAFGRNTSAIAVATNPTLNPDDPNYKWTDQGIVVQSRTEDDFNTIDPTVQLDDDGKLWLAFGSFWSGIKLVQLDPKTGKRLDPDGKLYPLAHYRSIEAAEIYPHDGYYYLMVDWGLCCRGLDSTYEMRVGRSRQITGPYLDKDGKDMLTGGGSPLLATDGAFVGPGHPGIFQDGGKFYMSMHFYDGSGSSNGTGGTLAIRPLTWDAQGWPVVGKW